MASKKRSALLVGATGMVGGYVLKELLKEEAYERVHVVTRRSIEKDHGKLREHLIDFNELESALGEIEADHVYIAIGTTISKAKSKEAFKEVDLEYPYKIADIMHERGAKKLAVVSALGADVESNFFYSRVKGEMEEKITGIPYKGTYLLRPALLLGPRKEFRFGEKMGEVANAIFKPVMLGSLERYKGIKASHVARTMIQLMLKGPKGLFFIESHVIRKVAKGKVHPKEL